MLPKLVDPRRLAEQLAEFRETIAVSALPRIEEFVESASKDVQVELVFKKDQQYRARVSGQVEGSVDLICQRCMEPVAVSFKQDIDLIVVYTEEQAKSVPKEVDPWEVSGSANLHELIEDEIFLALPVVAMHQLGECEAPPIAQIEIVVEQEEGRQRPFEILKNLTKTSDDQ